MQPELQSLIPLVELTQRSLKQEGQDGRSEDKLCTQANSNTCTEQEVADNETR